MSDFNVFDIFKMLYTKNKVKLPLIDMGINILFSKWICRDKDALPKIANIFKEYLYWISPQSYFYLLFFTIPQKYSPPFLKKYAKDKEIKRNKVSLKAQKLLRWSDKEYQLSGGILEMVLSDTKYWKAELGVK